MKLQCPFKRGLFKTCNGKHCALWLDVTSDIGRCPLSYIPTILWNIYDEIKKFEVVDEETGNVNDRKN